MTALTERQRLVLEALDELGRPLTVTEIAHTTGAPRSTVHQALMSLTRKGLASQLGASGSGAAGWILAGPEASR